MSNERPVPGQRITIHDTATGTRTYTGVVVDARPDGSIDLATDNRGTVLRWDRDAYRLGVPPGSAANPNRWAAFTDDELERLRVVLTDYAGGYGPHPVDAGLFSDVWAEIKRRRDA